MVEPNQMAG